MLGFWLTVIAGHSHAAGWQEHRIRQGDGQGGWVTRPALRQVLKHPDADFTMPFGLVHMDNGEIALICSREKQPPGGRAVIEPIIALSKDGGTTWSDFTILPGIHGRPMNLTDHGGGKLSLVTDRRYFSPDYGRTWKESAEHPPANDGRPINLEGNAWVDRDERGLARAILEVGDYHEPGKRAFEEDWISGVFRRSVDGGKTWGDEVSPPQWKTVVEYQGKKWSRGVAEGAVVRAASGDLVAALRTDSHPKFLEGPHGDQMMGTAISISHDDGKTWSEMRQIAEEGRHHANLQRLPNGDLVCTLIVRVDIHDGKLASHRRGCDALISHDHGQTWNLDRPYELDAFDFAREDGYWIDGQCGHVGAVALPDGSMISAYGDYRYGTAVLIKWKPDAEPAVAMPKVGVQLGPKASDLERYAADELAGYLGKLFRIEAQPAAEALPAADFSLLIGTPESNPTIAKVLGTEAWPKVSDQGIVLKRAVLDGKPALIIGGGSPRATLWAVYELVERWGVRYLLHGDVLPDPRGPFRLPEKDVVLEPLLRIREWRVVNEHATGPVSWGMADYRPVLDQLAKLKFNRIQVSTWPLQPFVDYEAGGIRRKTARLFWGYRFPITKDMPGRQLFGAMTELENPDFPRDGDYKSMMAAGERHLHQLMEHARGRGMQSVLTANLGQFPSEFQPFLKSGVDDPSGDAGGGVIGPGKDTDIADSALLELNTAVLRATINTYPEVDFLQLGMPEFRQWTGQYDRFWKALDAKYGIEKMRPLAEVLSAASHRTGYPGGAKRAVQEVKGDIVDLYYYDHLLTDLKVQKDSRRPDIHFIYSDVAEELFPILAQVIPAGSETLNAVDYTPSRILRRRDVLKNLPQNGTPSTLIYTLNDDNIGVLPQLMTGSLHELTQDLRSQGWAGFSTRYWTTSDQDPCVAYLARAAWDADTTPEKVDRDLLRAVCGTACAESMLTLFRELEAATIGLEWHGLGFAFPVPGMMTKQFKPTPFSSEMAAVRASYQRALDAARIARGQAGVTGCGYVDYWIGRLEFAIGYLDAVEASHLSAQAEAQKKPAEALQHAEAALAAARQALEGYARVARDQSDRATIAVMGEFVFRPLKARVEVLRTPDSERR